MLELSALPAASLLASFSFDCGSMPEKSAQALSRSVSQHTSASLAALERRKKVLKRMMPQNMIATKSV